MFMLTDRVYGYKAHAIMCDHIFMLILSQVEKLLAEVSAAGGSGATIDLDSHSRLLERVAGEVSRLSFQSNRGKVRGRSSPTGARGRGGGAHMVLGRAMYAWRLHDATEVDARGPWLHAGPGIRASHGAEDGNVPLRPRGAARLRP